MWVNVYPLIYQSLWVVATIAALLNKIVHNIRVFAMAAESLKIPDICWLMEQAAGKENHIPGETHFKRFPVSDLTETLIAQHCTGYAAAQQYQHIIPHSLEVGHGIFVSRYDHLPFPPVSVLLQEQQLLVSCTCTHDGNVVNQPKASSKLQGINDPEDRPRTQQLCEHEAQVLTAIVRKEDFGVFFFEKQRYEKLKRFAVDYGLSAATDLDAFFTLQFENNRLSIVPRQSSLLAVNTDTLKAMQQVLYPAPDVFPQDDPKATGKAICVVFRQHKYHKHLLIALYSAPVSREGKIKNPMTEVPPLELAWTSDDPECLKFYTAVHKFQQYPAAKRSQSDLIALKAIIRNPLGYRFYYHDPAVSDNITATSVMPVHTAPLPGRIVLTVAKEGDFYSVGGRLVVDEKEYTLGELTLKFTYFVQVDNNLYLVDQLQALGIIELLRKKNHFLVHTSKYGEFKSQLLDKLEEKINIGYEYIQPGTRAQLAQQGFDHAPQRIIYLSDLKNYVMIIPVMRYGDVEIPIRTQKLVYGTDKDGKEFLVKRDEAAEAAFTCLIVHQHPHFDEQLENGLHYWYLHRDRFLSEDWFLQVFEEWRREGITVLGFNELEGNKLNGHKAKINIKVLTGINWFNAKIDIRFGQQKATLQQVYKSLRNHNKYIQLDDGTKGILPAEWLEKFRDYFNNAEIIDESTIRIDKINFSLVEKLYEDAAVDADVMEEVQWYRDKLQNLHTAQEVPVPAALQGTLRPYQKAGLNWLNLLDELNFGGCLADDMGLGKSIQVIAFILAQRNKVKVNTNLLVVPSTLIFNWQEEVARFAPSINIRTIHGAGRTKSTEGFEQYEIILTSYGTLLSDIEFLKDYVFNYIFLDESQNIKNPETQRYKAVRLLQSRNKIAITGTPIENNTFDLFSQLSFACPGLLGNKQYFRDVYAVPIDIFKNSKRALELHHKVKPFILRRTKQEVATELPEKTEMVLLCEMDEAQRKLYDVYEKEFREYISATTNETLKKSPMNVLKGLTKLRQICDSPALLAEDDLTGHSSAKINTLIEQIETKSPQHKILVFSQFVAMLELIEKELVRRDIGFEKLTGSTRNRGAVIDAFQQNPGKRVFLISLKAGGTGLNLTEADYVYLVDPWWNPAVENQAIGRAHRIGQDKKVIAIRLICPGTVEEKIMKMQATKRSLADDLIKSGSSLLNTLSKEELLELLGD